MRHLLTHTSGIGSRSTPIYRAEQVRLRSITLPQMVDNAARVPLFEDPGTRFRYGISTTILGRLVEIWSGQPFDEFLAERLFAPLGMTDTVFRAEGERADRLTTVYRLDDGSGELYPYAIEDVPFTERPTLIEGGVGLLSTVTDYLRFSQMLLNGGTLNGVRVLASDTVALMTRNHVPDAVLPLSPSGYMAGSGWGLGFNVVLEPRRYPFPVGDGEYWWDGSSGTRFLDRSRARPHHRDHGGGLAVARGADSERSSRISSTKPSSTSSSRQSSPLRRRCPPNRPRGPVGRRRQTGCRQ